jgi:biopolymer transport protein ExbD
MNAPSRGPAAAAEVEETQRNLTPMIDVVFQLIVFFLLTLEFSTPEHEIHASLPRPGMAPTPEFVPTPPTVRVRVFRRDEEDFGRAHTVARVDSGGTIELPPTAEDDRPAREAALARIGREAALRKEALEGDEPVRAVIDARPPTGARVPHGEVVGILDALIEAGFRHIAFEGTAMPSRGR